MLEIKNLFVEREGKEILKDISLKVKDKKILLIVGKNGSGKSTLINTIMGLSGYNIKKGEIKINNKKINNLSIDKRVKLGISLGWQILPKYENLKVYDLFEAVFFENDVRKYYLVLDEFLENMGLEYSRIMNRKLHSLSGGEKKKIELLITLLVGKKLYLLDEPDSGVDTTSLKAIKEIIKEMKTNGSVILVSHNENLFDIADDVLLMCDGKIMPIKKEDIKDHFINKCKQKEK